MKRAIRPLTPYAACLWTAAALLLALPAWAAAPQEIRATYTLKRNGEAVGRISDVYIRNGNEYRLESETVATGVYAVFARGKIRLVSAGEVTESGLQPRRFEHHRGTDESRTAAADFDWDKRELSLHFDGKTDVVPLEPGTQDRLSIEYQFIFLPRQAKELSVPMTNGKKVDRFIYRLIDKPQLNTPAGQFKTLHFSRRQADDDHSDVWVAPGRYNVPVRIVVAEHNGDTLEQVLSKLEIK